MLVDELVNFWVLNLTAVVIFWSKTCIVSDFTPLSVAESSFLFQLIREKIAGYIHTIADNFLCRDEKLSKTISDM